MSKKLIAVAAAAALALTGLVATPATAATISSVSITDSSSSTAVVRAAHVNADSAVTANTWASARNVQFSTASTDQATRTAVRFEVLTAGATPVTVTSTGGVKIATTLTTAGVPIKVDGGSTTLTGATTAGSAASLTYTFFAWSTSTTAGSVVIETTNSKAVYFVKGTLGPAYNLTNVTFPATLFTGQTTGRITYQTSDAYGNLTDAAGPALRPTGFNAGTLTDATYSATTKLWTATLGTIAGDNVALNLTVPAFDAVDYTQNGFPAAQNTAFRLISAGNLSTQVTNLTAQVASLQAQLAALTAATVTKAKYNKLVRKWNRANPNNKVKRVS